MSISPIVLLWSVVSVLVSVACTISFVFPSWITHPDLLHSFGMFNYCVRNTRTSLTTSTASTCLTYSHATSVAKIPSGAWNASCILFGSGCVFQCVAAIVSVGVVFLRKRWHRRLAVADGYLQTVAVLIMTAGLLMFPMGFDTPFFRYYCGEKSGQYNSGHCSIGWSYMLAILGVAISIFCPILSNLTDAKHNEDDMFEFL
ncbi:LHFPL tetraspan subfamily member 2 protein-like [Gigantopelta aegis]|uniref:LHFPL tetraspan subfamily member 2 protein-like n=1 Tax=Gigantopelta aegis TaxID=1735272 RepID=UPI001B88BC05|nr:LHFPL tetraspan subfamily member 2 protein-like [Gigantopelta aegis]